MAKSPTKNKIPLFISKDGSAKPGRNVSTYERAHPSVLYVAPFEFEETMNVTFWNNSFVLKDKHNGEWPMSQNDANYMLQSGLLNKGFIAGRWGFVKASARSRVAHGLKYLGE